MAMTGNILQTLDRGIQALKIIAAHPDGISIANLASALDINRAIAYRLVGTLEMHGWVTRTQNGGVLLGAGLLELEAGYMRQLREKARPVLDKLAHDCGATAFLSIAEGENCVAIAVAEPDNVMIRVGYRLGSRHPLDQGAAGIAILSARPAQVDEDIAVTGARDLGYSLTTGQLQKGAVGVAVPLKLPRNLPLACIGVVAMEDLDQARSITLVKEQVDRFSQAYQQDMPDQADY